MKHFSELQLPAHLASALEAMEYLEPTPVQAQAIPLLLAGHDLIACAQTGTGKTAAFAVPLVERLLRNPEETALVLLPTRELAAQVHDVLKKLCQFLPEFKMSMIIGGSSMMPQKRSLLKKPRIIVATPGRLLDHLRQGTASLAKVAYLVLDEADRMLDMGFAPQLRDILRKVPSERQTLLFSATLPSDILELSRSILKTPRRVDITPSVSAPKLIDQQSREIQSGTKNAVLLGEVKRRSGSILVFVRTQTRTDRVAQHLESAGIAVARIHGGLGQGQRKHALAVFREGKVRVLVATDLAARGLDISHVAHVINYDLPDAPEDYVHRIGRTGRAGRSGEALSLIAPEDRALWRDILKIMSGAQPSKPWTPPSKNLKIGPAGKGRSKKHRRIIGGPHSRH